jgi:hypothetical protein
MKRAMPDPVSGEGVRARPRKQPYTLYAAGGRVYAQNGKYAVIDLGALTRQDDGFCYVLDGNKLSGSGFFTAEAALRDIARRLHFLWLDGQFTALADMREKLDLSRATRLSVQLDELGASEPVQSATV